MHIVFVCNEYPPRPHAGIGTFVQAIARGFDAKGVRVTVVGLGEIKGDEMDGRIRVITLRKSKLRLVGNLISRLRLRNWLASYANAQLVDIIEAPDYVGLLPFGVEGCTVVIRLHQTFTAVSQLSGQKVSKGIAFYERRTLTANGNWIGVSNHILETNQSIFGVSPKRAVMIYNPAPPIPSEVPHISNLPGEYILSLGHVCKRKGALILAEACRELMLSRPSLHLVYVGGVFSEGGRKVSEQVLEIMGPKLAGRVHFPGHLDRRTALGYMIHSKLLAFPSQVEALGLAVLEAMTCGIPVVCTKNPPGPELVDAGVTGLLADPFSPSDFREKMAQLLDDTSLGARLVANAKDMVGERFSLEKCVNETERFYRECLGTSNPPHPSAHEAEMDLNTFVVKNK